MLNIQQIVELIPHRYPFLLVDRIIELEENKRAVGIKNVSMNEPFFIGHFPEHPVMPQFEINRMKGEMVKGKGTATVKGELVCEADISFAFVQTGGQ